MFTWRIQPILLLFSFLTALVQGASASTGSTHAITIWNNCDYDAYGLNFTNVNNGVPYTGPQPPQPINYMQKWTTNVPYGWSGSVQALNSNVATAFFQLDFFKAVNQYWMVFSQASVGSSGMAILTSNSCQSLSCSDNRCLCNQAYGAQYVQLGQSCASSAKDAHIRSCSPGSGSPFTVKLCPGN